MPKIVAAPLPCNVAAARSRPVKVRSREMPWQASSEATTMDARNLRRVSFPYDIACYCPGQSGKAAIHKTSGLVGPSSITFTTGLYLRRGKTTLGSDTIKGCLGSSEFL